MSFENVPALLDHAIRLEGAAIAFYDHLLHQDPEPEAEAMLRLLIDQEKKHACQLAEFKQSTSIAGFLQNVPAFPLPPLDLLAERRHLPIVDLLKIALQFEISSRDFYTTLAQFAPNEPIRDFFAALARFEQGHIDLITRQLSYS